MIPMERETRLDEAKRRMDNELRSGGLQWSMTYHGNAAHTAIATLHRDDMSCTGVGKGGGEPSRVGALFEAFEHYVSLHHEHSYRHTLLPPVDVITRLGAPVESVLATQPRTPMACRTYVDPVSGRSRHVPLALSHPLYSACPAEGDLFDYTALRRYASNSGTAAGSTLYEAALHAINENIERDDLSHFLRTHFHDRRIVPLRLVQRQSADEGLRDYWAWAEAELGRPVTVIELSEHEAAHTFLAFTRGRIHTRHLYGTGASADASHAVFRALAELVQIQTVAAYIPSVVPDLAAEEHRLRSWPRLLRSCIADLTSLLASRPISAVHLPPRNKGESLRHQFENAVHSLAREGHETLWHVLHERSDGATVCQVLNPGFDRYYLVSHGCVVAPHAAGSERHVS